MPSAVDIVNQALVLIGDKLISALSDTGDRAIAANAIYATVRDAVLTSHPWRFAIVRDSLTPDVASPEYGWSYAYTLPTSPKCLRVLDIDEDNPGDIPWAIEYGKLLCNESTIKIRYIAQVTDPNLWDFPFIQAMKGALAVELASALTKKTAVLETAIKFFGLWMPLAQAVDGKQGTADTTYIPDLTRVRY